MSENTFWEFFRICLAVGTAVFFASCIAVVVGLTLAILLPDNWKKRWR